VIAVRDLGRNRRRTLLTLAALGIGLALLIATNGLIDGTINDVVENSVALRTGHLQLRRPSFDEDQMSLLAADLVENPDVLSQRAAALPDVAGASPVLLAATILTTPDETTALQLMGLDPASSVHARVMDSLESGQRLAADDRGGVLLGRRLADQLGIEVGDNVDLTVVDGEGRAQEGPFAVRGLFATGIHTFDDSVVIMPLAKAQALAGVGQRASLVKIMLDDPQEAEATGRQLESPGVSAVTWQTLNQLMLTAKQSSQGLYSILYGIVILVVAAILINTQLMAVFERTREIGILAALGLRRRQVLGLFMLEAVIIGLLGALLGVVLGLLAVAYLASHGLYIGDVASVSSSIAIGTTMRARFVPGAIAGLTVAMLAVVWLGALYPAWFASRLEPAKALGR
jgi:ABC-type lipoprotein release transport system permease subunit